MALTVDNAEDTATEDTPTYSSFNDYAESEYGAYVDRVNRDISQAEERIYDYYYQRFNNPAFLAQTGRSAEDMAEEMTQYAINNPNGQVDAPVQRIVAERQTARDALQDSNQEDWIRDNEENLRSRWTSVQGEQLISEGRSEQEALEPLILQELGLVRGDDGSYRRMTTEERLAGMTDEERADYESQRERDRLIREGEIANARTAAAYARGEGEVPSWALSELGRSEEAIRNQIAQRLGPGYLLSTPGIQAEGDIAERRARLMDDFRYGRQSQALGLLGQGQSIAQGGTGFNRAVSADEQGRIQGFGNRNMGYLGAYNQALQPSQFQQGLNQQMDIAQGNWDLQRYMADQQRAAANQAGRYQMYGALLGGGAGLLGRTAGWQGLGASSPIG